MTLHSCIVLHGANNIKSWNCVSTSFTVGASVWGSRQRAVTGGVRTERARRTKVTSVGCSVQTHIAAASVEMWTLVRCEKAGVCTAWYIVRDSEFSLNVSGVHWRHCRGKDLWGIMKTESQNWSVDPLLLLVGLPRKTCRKINTSWRRICTSWQGIHTRWRWIHTSWRRTHTTWQGTHTSWRKIRTSWRRIHTTSSNEVAIKVE